MTQRERTLATAVGALFVGVGIFGVVWFIKAFVGAQEEIDILKEQITSTDEEIIRVTKAKEKLNHWRRLSLPTNMSVARSSYRKDLEELIRTNGVTLEAFGEAQQDSSSSVMHPNKAKTPVWKGINYTVRVKAELPQLVSFLQAFQRAPRMQRIKKITIDRPSSSRDGKMLTAMIDFEGLVILDADLKRNNATDKKFTEKYLVPDMVAAFHKVPFGVGGFAWYLSPVGPYVSSVNPPLAERQYEDINRKNFFIGPQSIVTPPPPTTVGGGGKDYKFPPSPSDETINMMRFARFVSLVSDTNGSLEAKIWDMYHNTKQRLSTSPGMKKFGLVQTGQHVKIIQGTVYKMEGTDVIYRISLNADDPDAMSKWWRYPARTNYYTLHPDDMASLVKEGKVKANDKSNIYLIPTIYWDQVLIRRGKEVIEVMDVVRDGKKMATFRYLDDPGLRGEEIYGDREVKIVRMSGAPPTTPVPPSISAEIAYKDDKTIYRVQTKHFEDMMAAAKAVAGAKGAGAGGKGKGKGAEQTGLLKKEDINNTYVMRTYYWDMLAAHKILVPDSIRMQFSFYKGTVCGDILSRSDDLVVFRTYEQYTHCPKDDDRKTPERWHEGYCILKLDQFVQESLQEPLPESRRVALKLPK